MISELNDRSREIFRFIVDTYLETGHPVGSRTISRTSGICLSPASIRNTMADLEELGLLYAPHTSAGRMPTQTGLRLYIDGLMEIGGLSERERKKIENHCLRNGSTVNEALEKATDMLSGLSSCASLVVAPKMDNNIRQIQFIPLDPCKVLVVLVMENGMVENRVMDVPENTNAASLIAASNYLNSHLSGKTITQAQKDVAEDIRKNRTHLDKITADLVEAGLALPLKNAVGKGAAYMIVRGQSHLLEDVKALEDLQRARALLGYLEEQEMMLSLIKNLGDAEGVQIFIGSENKIFDQSGWSLIISPYRSASQKIVGAIGVIGPTRLDYDRIIPMVDYTSQIIGRLYK
ncbi:MAG: heat-inducible transcriptional repressor HrcA [Alphaproteobacteria bacterium]|nr:heat-inducible transcriptional repressor HrcA [Alphaproteobacteria bacterium]MCB9975853.1 heat-inducible transcriptional repressor HrcA [Rhodospirillales bacterium]